MKTLNPLSPTDLSLDLYIWVKQRVSYKLHALLTIHEHLGSALLFGGSVLLIHEHLSSATVVFDVGPCFSLFFSVLCCPIMCLYLLSSVLWCPIRFPHTTMFGSSSHPVVCMRALVSLFFCACLCIVMSNILLLLIFLVFCIVFFSLFVFVLCLACDFFDLSIHVTLFNYRTFIYCVLPQIDIYKP